MDLRRLLHILRRNAVLLLLIMAAGAELGILNASRQPDVYRATSEVLLRPENQGVDPNLVGSTARFDAARFATVESAVITSAAMAERVLPQVPGADVESILESVGVTVSESNAILTISAVDDEPERAALMANAAASTYVAWRQEQEAGAVERAIAELDEQLVALRERLEALEAEAAAAAAAATETGAGAALAPSADFVAAQDQYAATFSRQQDLAVQLSLQRPTAEVLREASVPVSPVGLGPASQAVLGALLAGVLGLALAFAREELDDRVRSSDEVQAVVGVPVLAELPADRRSARYRRHLAVAQDPQGRLAEAIRALRTSITFASVGEEGIHSLLVTSTAAGDGKTLVSANLAAAYAQAGRPTVVVSADLRRPRLEYVFGYEPGTPGLSDAFVFESQDWSQNSSLSAILQEVIVPTDVANLWLLPAGRSVPNPAELLSSARMAEVVARLEERFDMVVFDTSPLLPVTDAAALSSNVGRVLIVANARNTRRRAIAKAVRTVTTPRTHVLGVVLNRVSGKAATYRHETYGPAIGGGPQAAVVDQPVMKVR